jgi:ComF family protein
MSAAVSDLRKVSAHLLEAFTSLFFPHVCQICLSHRATKNEGYICAICWSSPKAVQFVRPPFCERCGLPYSGDITTSFECRNCRDQEILFRQARAAVVMANLTQQVIHRYKYNHALWFEPFLVDLILRASEGAICTDNYDLLLPIPLHWLKKYQREFNQAERLARSLSRATGVPVGRKLIARVKQTPTQTRFSRTERAHNMQGAFRYLPSSSLPGSRILLIDDVLTTGATANACAKALMDNGAALVDVWTVARGTLN